MQFMPANPHVAYAIAAVQGVHVQIIADVDAAHLVIRRRRAIRRRRRRQWWVRPWILRRVELD
jgi:hypothetical protein